MTARSALWATLWAAENTARARTSRLAPAPGRLCAGPVLDGQIRACGPSGGLAPCSGGSRPSLGAVGPPVAIGLAPACLVPLPAGAPACRSPALWGHASRSEGCRYGRIRGLPGRGDGKIDREPVILGMHRRQLGLSRPMARGRGARRRIASRPREPHHLQHRVAEQAVGVTQRLGQVEVAVVLGDDEFAQLSGIAHRGGEFLGLADELRRLVGAVGDDERARRAGRDGGSGSAPRPSRR